MFDIYFDFEIIMLVKLQKNNKAFTLLEVVIAASFLTLGLVSSIQMFAAGLQFSRSMKLKAMAAGIAQEKMEGAFSLGYDDVGIGKSGRERFSVDSTSPFYGFETQTEIFYADSNLNISGSDAGLKRIQVDVFWNESNGEKSEQVVALMADR